MASEPTIGIICDTGSPVLAGRIKAAGYRVVLKAPADLRPGDLPAVEAWVIDCGDDPAVVDAMEWIEDRVLALSNRPDPADAQGYGDWSARVLRTLDKWTADSWQQAGKNPSSPQAWAEVEAVWVLAGSTGGVSAVGEFFRHFSHLPRIAFIYAQHIHAEYQALLTTVGHANRELVCTLATGRHWLNPGHVLIVPASCKLSFPGRGEVFSLREGWETAETPNIDQLLLTLSGLDPAPAGAIIFSGAGRDGCEGLRALRAVGTEVWAQAPASAVAPSMPNAAIEEKLSTRVGTPAELAAALMQRYPG